MSAAPVGDDDDIQPEVRMSVREVLERGWQMVLENAKKSRCFPWSEMGSSQDGHVESTTELHQNIWRRTTE